MPMTRYKPEQVVTLLRQIEVAVANGKTTPQACKEAQITAQTYYRWRVSAKRTASCKESRRVAVWRHDQALPEGVDEVAKAGFRTRT